VHTVQFKLARDKYFQKMTLAQAFVSTAYFCIATAGEDGSFNEKGCRWRIQRGTHPPTGTYYRFTKFK